MVRIITGKINSGKTTKIREVYEKNHQGDGFISRKIMIGSLVYGFNSIRLSNNVEIPFLLHERYYPENETIYIEDDENAYLYKIGPYHVVKQSMTMISNTYRELILSEINPIYFDEVGVLELRKQGYYDSICLALANKKDIVITIRDDLILKFLDLFKITEYRIISG